MKAKMAGWVAGHGDWGLGAGSGDWGPQWPTTCGLSAFRYQWGCHKKAPAKDYRD